MKVTETIERVGNKFWLHHEYIRDHWYEWLYVKIGEGEARPIWYLPVSRSMVRFGYTAWIFPLAPFALLALIINNCFWSIWRDLVEFAYLSRKYRNNAAQERRDFLKDV